MKKHHGAPARGSYKEAKMIQAKKKAKSFFDYTEKEKREILLTAAHEASRFQRKLIQEYARKGKID